MPFVFEGGDVRGAVVDLDHTWREVLKRHAYPLHVRSLLGQAMAAGALLSSTLKFDGTLVLQTRAANDKAPVRLMVVECNADLAMRATARLGDAFAQAGGAEGLDTQSLADLVGDGKLVITLDPREDDKSAYQGVVPLAGADLGAALENYMLRSEQLETRIFLAADERRAAGLLIQKMPAEGGHAAGAAAQGGLEMPQGNPSQAKTAEGKTTEGRDGATIESRWPDAEALASTITSQELLMLEPREILHRLFHEFDLRLFAERATTFQCSCSRERVAGMLRALGREEVESVVAEQGAVTVNCEFCNQAYAFDPVDAAQLFAAGAAGSSVPDKGVKH